MDHAEPRQRCMTCFKYGIYAYVEDGRHTLTTPLGDFISDGCPKDIPIVTALPPPQTPDAMETLKGFWPEGEFPWPSGADEDRWALRRATQHLRNLEASHNLDVAQRLAEAKRATPYTFDELADIGDSIRQAASVSVSVGEPSDLGDAPHHPFHLT